ncbi:MAG: hypothetical protein AAF611_10675 [Bacteroidota bacterium]
MYISSYPFIHFLIELLKLLGILSDNKLSIKGGVNKNENSRTLNSFLNVKLFRILIFSKLSILFFGLYLMLFSVSIYSIIPEQFGGAKPKPMILSFDTNSCKELIKSDIMNLENCQTKEVYVIFETDDYFIIRSNFKKIIKIKRSNVSSIITGGFLNYN